MKKVTMKILVFAASLRKASLNKKLIRQVVEILKNIPNMNIDHADYRDFEMPIYDGDLEDKSGVPAGGLEFIRRIQSADAIIISTPEYNGGIPGTLKNAIDWASRVNPIPFTGKPILLIGASIGKLGAVRGLWHTRVPLEAIGAYVYPEMFGLSKAHQMFNEQGEFIDSKNRETLEQLIILYIKHILLLISEPK